MPGQLNWSHLDVDSFNRFVEVLLVRSCRNELDVRAYAVDGRGGDEGIDVAVERAGVVERVYQLKFFPEGFSGGFSRVRRRQIKESFETAWSHWTPSQWTLVVPTKVTLKERQFLSTLRGNRTVQVSPLGNTQLDDLLASYPDIANWIQREPVLDELKQFHAEKAALAGPMDLAERVAALAQRVDERSPNWGVGFRSQNGQVEQWLYAKRADAAEREPLAIDFTASFGPKHQDLHAQLVELTDWGATTPLVLPSDVVSHFRQSGPEWFAQEFTDVQIELLPLSAGPARRVELRAINEDGATIASLTGEATFTTPGVRGATMTTTFRDCLTLTWRVPKVGGTSSVRVALELDDARSATDAAAAARFLGQLGHNQQMELLIDGQHVFEVRTHDARLDGVDEYLESLVADLAYLERELGVVLAIPNEMSGSERLHLRIARMVLEGRCAVWPFRDTLDGTLNGVLDASVRLALSGKLAIGLTTEHYAIEIDGQSIDIGDVQVLHPCVSANDAAAHLEALEAGRGAGRTLVLRPADGTPFRAYSPSRWIERWGDPARPFVPEPWRIPGVDEHAKLGEMRAQDRGRRGAKP